METWRDQSVQQWVQALGETESETRDSVPNLTAIAQLSRQIEAEHERHFKVRGWRRRGLVALALATSSVAAAAAGWVVLGSHASPSGLAEVRALQREVQVEGAPTASRLSVGRQLTAGDTLVTGSEAHLDLAVSGGGTLALGGFSELRLLGSANASRLTGARLGRGSVEIELPKQPTGEHFSVNTPDATVTVVGTKFEVRIAEGPSGPITCVHVTHGRVRVESRERQALLAAGESWVSRGELAACTAGASLATAPAPEGSLAPAAQAPSAAGARRPALTGAAPGGQKSSSLAAENSLFLELVRARRSGHNEAAQVLQRRFLLLYPDSALAPQVLEEQRKTP